MTGEAKPGLEATKWLAFALMVADHANAYLLEYRYPLVYLLGRLVFPLFALALAEGLARGGELRASGTLRRLLLWACIAQVPWSFLPQSSGLNVLFSLACGLAGYLAIFGSSSWGRRLLWGASAFLVSAVCDYGVAGFAMVLTACWWRERHDSRVALGAFVVGLALLYAENGTWFALLALPAFLGLRYAGDLPRWRHGFYYLYAGQFVVLAFVRETL